jgi:hypothetical protein
MTLHIARITYCADVAADDRVPVQATRGTSCWTRSVCETKSLGSVQGRWESSWRARSQANRRASTSPSCTTAYVTRYDQGMASASPKIRSMTLNTSYPTDTAPSVLKPSIRMCPLRAEKQNDRVLPAQRPPSPPPPTPGVSVRQGRGCGGSAVVPRQAVQSPYRQGRARHPQRQGQAPTRKSPNHVRPCGHIASDDST